MVLSAAVHSSTFCSSSTHVLTAGAATACVCLLGAPIRIKDQRDNCVCTEDAASGQFVCHDQRFPRQLVWDNDTLTWYGGLSVRTNTSRGTVA
jgi:hypothetical protein